MKYLLHLYLFTAVFYGYSQNVLISNQNTPSEPSIKINPQNTNYIVAGSVLNHYYFSNDSGITWQPGILNSSYGVWGDPVIDVDSDGNFYYFHLSNPPSGNWIDRIVCQKSTDNGQTWNDGTFTGLNGTKAQDKHWSIIDPNTNTIYLTWTQFDAYGSTNPADKSIILFSKSTDQGATWSTPLKINQVDGDCVDSDNTVEGAVPALGPNGEIYVSWAGPNGLVFNKSLDGGNTWLNQEIQISAIPGGWDFAIPGIYRANGLPITKCDVSGGPNNGTIYVNWADQRNGINNTDVWLSKSTDQGETWSTPVRVNNDTSGKQQFFTWMDIDQTNGNLFFVFYDRRDYNDTQTDVYLAYTTDGGETFSNVKISESPFTPNPGVFFGDYTNLSVHNNIVRPIWTRLDGGSLSVWTDVTPFQILSNPDFKRATSEVSQYPNPASEDTTYVTFKLKKNALVNLALYNQDGKKVKTLINNEQKNYGKYIIPIQIKALGLASGTYYCKLHINGSDQTLKIIVIK
jgi:hypothetical protein